MLSTVRALGDRVGRPRSLARVRAFFADGTGSTAIEYTIIAGLVSVAIVASFGQITTPLIQLFDDMGAGFKVK